jgi:transcriptional regulator of acetoin/glycerol metabolism
VLLAEDDLVNLDDLPPSIAGERSGSADPIRLPIEGLDWARMEESLIRQAVERASGNRAAAARLLGLSYKAFLYRLEKHGLLQEDDE